MAPSRGPPPHALPCGSPSCSSPRPSRSSLPYARRETLRTYARDAQCPAFVGAAPLAGVWGSPRSDPPGCGRRGGEGAISSQLPLPDSQQPPGTGLPLLPMTLGRLETDGGPVLLRRAEIADLPALVALLAADQLGASRDGIDGADGLAPYERAFAAIDADPAHLLVVGTRGGDVVATLQLSVLPGLARRGATRMQIEAVRVRSDLRGLGLGKALLRWSVDQARARGCALVQLTSDKSRHEAHRFYGGLGFVASHEGFKLRL